MSSGHDDPVLHERRESEFSIFRGTWHGPGFVHLRRLAAEIRIKPTNLTKREPTDMKQKHLSALVLGASAALAPAMIAHAGELETMEPAPQPIMEPEEDLLTGSLSLDANSHFISYGLDVWAEGNDTTGMIFNPSLELNWAFTENFTAILGTWWDVNGNGTSAIGGNLQEVDVYGGGSLTFGKFSATALYQAWIYGGDTEHIVDLTLAYDTFLSPSLTIHNRVEEGAAPDTGTILVAGVSHSFDAGPVSLSVPANVAFFLDEGFHPGTVAVPMTDDGFGYASVGINASIPLSFIDDAYGEWDLHGGLTYYITEEDVIPSNPEDSFLTANIGVGCSF